MDYYEIVKKIIGPIQPVGESHTDKIRFNNLEEMTELVDRLIFDISLIAQDSSRSEYSMKRAGEHAKKFLDDLEIEIRGSNDNG